MAYNKMPIFLGQPVQPISSVTLFTLFFSAKVVVYKIVRTVNASVGPEFLVCWITDYAMMDKGEREI